MNASKVKKSKEILENILKQTRDRFLERIEGDLRNLEQNLEVEIEQYQERVKKIKKEVLGKLNISEDQYKRAEIIVIVEEQLSGLEEKILSNLKIEWDEISNRPDFKKLESQTETLSGSVEKIIERIKSEATIIQAIEKKAKKLEKKIPKYHNDLINIHPDDHHDEKHSLESHLDSDLLNNLYRLVGGGNVDDLHTHKEKKGPSRRNVGLYNPVHYHNDVYYTKTELATLIPDLGLGDLVWNETPTGTVNGVNTDFTLANTPNSTSNMLVFVNGMLMQLTTDYTVSGAVITFVTAPPTGSIIMVTYQK